MKKNTVLDIVHHLLPSLFIKVNLYFFSLLAFHQRIQFCLDLHNHSVKAMRFPPKNYNQDLESAEDRREREAQDLELAKEMAEEDDDLM